MCWTFLIDESCRGWIGSRQFLDLGGRNGKRLFTVKLLSSAVSDLCGLAIGLDRLREWPSFDVFDGSCVVDLSLRLD